MKILFVVFLLSFCLGLYAQHPWLVKDINTTGAHTNQLADGTFIGGASCAFNEGEPDMQKMYKVNSFALFFADDGSGKRGLWRSDGTKNGTYFISDLDSIGFSASVSEAYSTGKLLYFIRYRSVYDSSTGQTHGSPKELWRSDGTTNGTFPAFSGADKRIDELFWNDNPENKVKGATIGNNFFFVAAQQIGDTVYSNIYKTDGTKSGTKPYFEIYKAQGTIETPFITGTTKIISFNNQLYFNYGNEETGSEIWVGDGINPPHLYCDFNPGPLSTSVGEWINLNDKYLILWASVYTSQSAWTNKIFRIKSTDTCPAVIDEDAGNSQNYYSPKFYDYSNNEYYITANKFFFKKQSNTGSRFLEATNDEANGTFNISFDAAQLKGVCTNGLIFTDNPFDSKTYIWDGNSPTSYRIFSDSLNATEANGYFSPYRVIQLDTAVFVAGSSDNNNIVWLTNVNGSYCYRVSTLNLLNKGINLSDTAYIALGDAFPSGTFPCGTEPVLLKKFDKVWIGKISSDWNNSSNWLPFGVPNFSESVVIPPAQYNPVINSQAACKDLFLNSANRNINGQGITVNKSANLAVHGYYFSLRGTEINGEGSLIRKGTFANTTYGDGAYNIDTINIDGADWDLTSMYFSEPNGFDINSVVNFKSDNKLIMNETPLAMLKKPYFTGFNNKRYIVNNRTYYSWTEDKNSPINIALYDVGSSAGDDSIVIMPVGTSTSSYSPLKISYPYFDFYSSINGYVTSDVRKNGADGDLITEGVVNKSWFINQFANGGVYKVTLSWNIKDETPGFNHNFCFIAYYDSSKWIKGAVQAAVFSNGLYSIEETFSSHKSPFIVCSDLNVLPVAITNFTAELINANANVFLKWQTATEINASHYNIQRSTNGVNFTTIDNVNSAGNSTSLKTYSYTDNVSKLNGTIYYRIEEVDKDGKTTLSQICTVKKSLQNLFTIFPNPAKDVANISGKNLKEVEIYDATGKAVLFKETNNASFITISIRQLRKGIYEVMVKDMQGNTETKKLFVE